jgi:hypothetical protein
MSTASSSIPQLGRSHARRAFIALLEAFAGVALAVLLAILLQETGELWFRSTSGVTPDLIEWSAIALVALGLLVGLPVAWNRIPPVTAVIAGTVLALAVAPWVFGFGDSLPTLDGYLLKLSSWPTTYLTIGVLFALSLRTWLRGSPP